MKLFDGWWKPEWIIEIEQEYNIEVDVMVQKDVLGNEAGYGYIFSAGEHLPQEVRDQIWERLARGGES